MIVILLATLLILAIAFFQATQGFYGAMITAVVALLSAVAAFNYYEALASLLYADQPAVADAIALLVLFLVLMVGLRLAADYLLRRNVVLGVWTNRIGGGVLGLWTGMVLVGVLVVAMQMLPWGPSVLGYTPFDDSLVRSSRVLPFLPDDFVVGTIDALSRRALSRSVPAGQMPHWFSNTHDDLLLELFCARNTAGKNGRIDAARDALSVGQAFVSDGSWGRDVPTDPRLGEVFTKVVSVRATVSLGAVDKDGWWRLPGTHFRLISESGRSYYPIGYLARTPTGAEYVSAPTEQGRPQPARLIVERKAGKERSVSVDWVYRVLVDEDGLDAPVEMVFRRICTGEIRKALTRFPDLTGGLEVAPPPAPRE
jgi:hypothetical protein